MTYLPTIGNVSEKFKDGFGELDTANWDFVSGAGDLIVPQGDAGASSFVAVSKSAVPSFGAGVETLSYVMSKKLFDVPLDVMAGLTLGQRMFGQEFAYETVGVDDNGDIISETMPPSVNVVGTIAIASNVATVNLAAGHGLLSGDWVVLADNAYSPLNVGPVIITGIAGNPNQFTFPCTAGNNAGYTAGGTIRRVCPCGFAEQHAGIRWYGATAGNADAVTENGGRPQVLGWNPGNTQDVALLPNEGVNYANMPYVTSLRPRGEWIIKRAMEYTHFAVSDQDSATPYRSSPLPRRQNNPDHTKRVKLRFRALSYRNLSKPVGAITAVTKSGTALATLTIPNHGLTVNDFIVIYGVRDQTNFANLTTATVVTSVIDANTITITFGGSFTGASYGGFAYRVNGNTIGTIQTMAVQSYAATADLARLVLVGSATWTATLGTIWTLYGLVDSTNTRLTALEGRYRVASIATTSIELVPLDGQAVSGVSTTPANAGGAILANSDFRLHYAKLLEYERMMIEAHRADGDRNRALPCEILNTPSVSISGTPAVTLSGTSNAVQGNAADSAAASGNPVLIGGRIRTGVQTDYVDGDAANARFDSNGRLIVADVEGDATLALKYSTAATPFSATTDTSMFAAAGASIRNKLTLMRVRNTSATAGALIIDDNATEVDRVWLPASMTTPIEVRFVNVRGTANTVMNIKCSVASMSVDITAYGVKEF